MFVCLYVCVCDSIPHFQLVIVSICYLLDSFLVVCLSFAYCLFIFCVFAGFPFRVRARVLMWRCREIATVLVCIVQHIVKQVQSIRLFCLQVYFYFVPSHCWFILPGFFFRLDPNRSVIHSPFKTLITHCPPFPFLASIYLKGRSPLYLSPFNILYFFY